MVESESDNRSMDSTWKWRNGRGETDSELKGTLVYWFHVCTMYYSSSSSSFLLTDWRKLSKHGSHFSELTSRKTSLALVKLLWAFMPPVEAPPRKCNRAEVLYSLCTKVRAPRSLKQGSLKLGEGSLPNHPLRAFEDGLRRDKRSDSHDGNEQRQPFKRRACQPANPPTI